MKPPENGDAACGSAATTKLTGLTEATSGSGFAQVRYQLARRGEWRTCQHTDTRIEPMPPAHALYAREILREIRKLRVRQAPFGRIFWSLEQRIARLTDEIERRGS